MTLATALTILGIVNGLLGVAKAAPAVITQAKELLAQVEPHVDELGAAVRAWFDELKAKVEAA